MKHEHLPRGTENEPIPVYDLLSAVKSAHAQQQKLWFRLRGDSEHLYEVWPGGRNIAWPRAILDRRRERQAPLPADYKCRHAWDYSGPWVQCFRCGQVREDRIPKEQP